MTNISALANFERPWTQNTFRGVSYLFRQNKRANPDDPNELIGPDNTSHVPEVLGLALVAYFLICMSVCFWIYWRDNVRNSQLGRGKGRPRGFEEQGRNWSSDVCEEPPPAYSLQCEAL
jgi:hypothetical protein